MTKRRVLNEISFVLVRSYRYQHLFRYFINFDSISF